MNKKFEQIETLYHAVLERPAHERAAWLEQACQGDSQLRSEVDALLVQHDRDSGLLGKDAVAAAAEFISRAHDVLSPATTLSHFEIIGSAGRGGMGQVYRARDTRLDRIVAIKVLAPELIADVASRSRLEREARAISALNHPNICTLHDVGRANNVDFLVMEYVEGETLAERLRSGTLPLDVVLRYGSWIADALAAAHKQGIVHRDLKPANVMLTKHGLKLLDFGLAKLMVTGQQAADASRTKASELTERGVTLGTLEYMAPEQVDGGAVDTRTDIFALGLLLYEMAGGRKAFTGTTRARLAASILHDEPRRLSELRPGVPVTLDRIVRQCLQKDPDVRWQSARDVLIAINVLADAQAASESSINRRLPRRRLAALLTTFLILVAVGFAVLRLSTYWNRGPVSETNSMSFSFAAPDGTRFTSGAAQPFPTISPDGRHIVFISGGNLWLRNLDAVEPREITDTKGAAFPFWSGDSRYVGFFANGKLKKVPRDGGLVQTVADAPSGEGGTWNARGDILFAPDRAGSLYHVSAEGGPVRAVTRLDSPAGQRSHRHPQFMPDGRHFTYLSQSPNQLWLGSLDGDNPVNLGKAESKAVYSDPGQLVFVKNGVLVAEGIDSKHWTLDGRRLTLVEEIGVNPEAGRAAFSVSTSGVLVYRAFTEPVAKLQWMDRTGKVMETVGEPKTYMGVEVAPDGQQFAVHVHEPVGGDVWTVDGRSAFTRVTFSAEQHSTSPFWSQNGEFLFFERMLPSGHHGIFRKPINRPEEELLYDWPGDATPKDYNSAADMFLFEAASPGTGWDIWRFSINSDRKAQVVLQTTFDERFARLSPSGHWMTYVSNETGRYEVYLRAFPEPTQLKVQLSTEGGSFPMWNADENEVFFRSSAGKMMGVRIDFHGVQPVLHKPVELFDADDLLLIGGDSALYQPYGVGSGGRRFLMPMTLNTKPSPVVVVAPWTALIKK